MRMNSFTVVTLLGFGLILLNLATSYGALQVGFYKGKCENNVDVESIIRDVVQARFNNDRSIVAALLRMQFHDCFVSGCDASLLLNGASSEKTAPPNLSVRGYDLIDKAKIAVEKACPGVVSCADIISIATRDAVSMSGFNTKYEVETGRKDGLVSLASNVDLPGPSISVSQSINAFAAKGLSPTDMVLLLGGHTVGVAHCSFFQDRLYNFNNTGRRDPNMEIFLWTFLRSRCPQNNPNPNTVVNLDQTFGSSLVVDNGYYNQILFKRGILQIDQALALDPSTRPMVRSLAANEFSFSTSQFGAAMVKLGAVGVLTGTEGEIRQTCGAVNTKPTKSTSNNLVSSLIN